MPSMMENISLAIIVAIPTVLSPLLMSWLQNRNLLKVKAQDYEREDEVAKNLLERQDAIAAKTAETAFLLRANNAAVARNAADTKDKLSVIHALVNSSMTAALQSELAACRRTLVLMTEMIDIKRSSGHEPSDKTVQEMGAIKAKVAELETTIAERLKQADEIAASIASH